MGLLPSDRLEPQNPCSRKGFADLWRRLNSQARPMARTKTEPISPPDSAFDRIGRKTISSVSGRRIALAARGDPAFKAYDQPPVRVIILGLKSLFG
jgi:hypothetical protein